MCGVTSSITHRAWSRWPFTPAHPTILVFRTRLGSKERRREFVEKQKRRDFKGMRQKSPTITLPPLPRDRRGTPRQDALVDKYEGVATRSVMYNAVADPDRLE